MFIVSDLKRQLVALLKRNLLLKRRELVQTFFEIVIPICIYVGVSFALNSLKPPKQVSLPPNTTIEYKPVELIFNNTYNRPGPVLLVVNTKDPRKRLQVYEAFKTSLGSGATVDLVSGSPNPDIAARSLKRRYLSIRRKAIDQKNLPVGVVIYLDQDLTHQAMQGSGGGTPFGSLGFDVTRMLGFYNYHIYLATPDLPDAKMGFLDTRKDSCLTADIKKPLTEIHPDDLSISKCASLYYARNGFLNLQNAVHQAILKIEVGLNEKIFSKKLSWQMMPRTTQSDDIVLQSGNDMDKTWASFTVYLAGIAVINLFSALVAGAVTEKEKGVKETMLLMGMNGLIWKTSWFIVYFCEMLLVSGLSTLITWLQSIMSGPAAGVFFILLLSYGFSLVSFGLLLVSIFKTARGAATATSFVFVVLGLPYIMVRLATMFSKSAIPTVGYYMLSFLFPFAFQRGMDMLLEANRNSDEGSAYPPTDISVWGMVLMLFLDGCIYLLIGLLVDYLPGIISDYKLAHSVRKVINIESSKEDNDELARNVEFDPSLESRRAIVINNLSKTFHKQKMGLPGQEKPLKVIDNLSLTIYGGQITCLLGHNGAGKTTLIRILTGSVKNYEGVVSIFNWQVESMRDIEELRRDIGVCAQQNTLFDNLTVEEHLSFVLELKSDLPPATRDSIVRETMALVSLQDKANTNAARLSGGEKRKLCLAMAVIAKPKLLFLDEPTAGVDVFCRRQIWDVLTQYKQADRVVLMTTHYMDEADMLADRKALMHCGRLYSAGSSMFLRQRFGCGYRLTVELDPSQSDQSKIEEITSALRAVMPDIVQMDSERSRSELVYALPTGEENNEKLLALLRFLETDQTQLARYGVLCYGWSIATLDEVFMKLEEEVAEHEEHEIIEDANTPRHSLFPSRKFLSKKNENENNAEVNGGTNGHLKMNGARNGHANGHAEPKGFHPPVISFSGIDVPEESPNSLRRHFVAIIYLRLMQTIRNIRVIAMRFLFPIIVAVLGLAMTRIMISRLLSKLMGNSEGQGVNNTAIFVYQPFIYANVSSDLTVKLKQTMMDRLQADDSSDLVNSIAKFGDTNGPFLLLKNYTENTTTSNMIGGYIDMMTSSFMSTTASADMDMPLIDIIEKYGSKIGAYFDIGNDGINEEKLMFSHSAIHALPSLLAYAHSMDSATEGFIPIFLPYLQSFSSADRMEVIQAYTANFIFVLLFAIHILTMLPSLGFDVVRDRESGCGTQIKLAGISKLSYWLGSFTVDTVEYAIFLLCFLAAAYGFGVYSLSFAGARYAFLIYVALVVPANVLLIYCLTLFVKTFRIFSSVVTMVTSMTGFFPFLIIFFWSFGSVIPMGGQFQTSASNLRFDPNFQTLIAVFCFVCPPFNAAAGVFLIALISQPNISTLELPVAEVSDYFEDKILRYMWGGAACHIVFFGTIILIHENWGTITRKLQMKGGLFKLFRKQAYLKSRAFANGGQSNGDMYRHRPEEDDDVIAERRDVFDLASAPVHNGQAAPYVSEARKVYTTLCRDCKPVEPKVAVEDVSFKLNYGQVFGLLGPNGAGKTTLIKMIIGSENPSSGTIFSRGSTALGYCPQENVLWDQLSGEEHVFIYSYSRGFSRQQRIELTRRLGDGLGIWNHLSKQTRRMSGGTKRKLNVALSLLGRPSVLCLDEPSAGMDPGSKRFLWRVIKQIFAAQSNDWQLAALLTTHHLDEAEALCHRIAIMVNGVLRCIGSRQHLKSKYGRYYTLEVKLGNDQLMLAGPAGLIDFIDKLLPDNQGGEDHEAPQLINNFGRHFVFRVPSSRVRSLGTIFSDLESVKQKGTFSSYSFSQVSLEQIFIQFAKEQYDD